jgi:hypothetical protein
LIKSVFNNFLKPDRPYAWVMQGPPGKPDGFLISITKSIFTFFRFYFSFTEQWMLFFYSYNCPLPAYFVLKMMSSKDFPPFCTLLQPGLEVFHCMPHHVLYYCDFLLNSDFQFICCGGPIDVYFSFEVTLKEIVTKRKIRWPSRPRKVTALWNDVPGKHMLHNLHRSSRSIGSRTVPLKPHCLWINSMSLQFWCKEVAPHVHIVIRIYCHCMLGPITPKLAPTQHQTVTRSQWKGHLWSCHGIVSGQ